MAQFLRANPVVAAVHLRGPRQAEKTLPSPGGWVWQGGQGQAGMETVIQIPLRQAAGQEGTEHKWTGN